VPPLLPPTCVCHCLCFLVCVSLLPLLPRVCVSTASASLCLCHCFCFLVCVFVTASASSCVCAVCLWCGVRFPQLGRVAFLVQGMPGFLKKLIFVLETVCGVVDRTNTSYVAPAVLSELHHRRPGRAVLKTVMMLACRATVKTPPSSSPKPLLSDPDAVRSALTSARDHGQCVACSVWCVSRALGAARVSAVSVSVPVCKRSRARVCMCVHFFA
jgi:hypothetical protein